jgi:hypothetical protein
MKVILALSDFQKGSMLNGNRTNCDNCFLGFA